MKTILYIAMTVNGYIAKENDDTPWSNEVWEHYYNFIKEKGNIILGRRTYEIMEAADEFEKLGNPVTAVVTTSLLAKQNPNIIFVSYPQEAMNALKKEGFSEIVIGGGSTLNASFLKQGLIDEIYLAVEPLIFGRGIKLFRETDAELKLELLNVENLSKNTIGLRYEVLR